MAGNSHRVRIEHQPGL